MAKQPSAPKVEDQGTYVWRGGQKIELEKEADRFTVIPSSAGQVDRVRSAPGVRGVKGVTNQVFKVETTPDERDAAMATLRAESFGTVVHHAYRPKGSEGTIYYLTDKIIVRFDPKATNAQIDKMLGKYALKVLKEYEGAKNTLLVQVTSSSGANPIKVANAMAEEKLVLSAEPNRVNRFRSAYIPPDGYFCRQWHLNAKKKPQLVAEASVQAPKAWDITRGERSIVVAVAEARRRLNP